MNNEFDDLFILDLANNHQGDVRHAKTIIKEMSEVVKKYKVKTAIKFQFRDLDNFVHKDKRESGKNKMVDRFLTTHLRDEQFFELKRYAASLGLLTACTPFDELSVAKIVRMGFDYIKIASCSAQDWSLLDKIRGTPVPLIASTGGLSLEEIDELVYFLSHKRKNFALMHCVAVYPTPEKLFNLGRINILSQRYPDLAIGWSTHENPADYQTIKLAYSLGARTFEKHVGKATKRYSLNQYSATKDDIDRWLHAFVEIRDKMVVDEVAFLKKQKAAIKNLSRGRFARKDLTQNEIVRKTDFYYAFPCGRGSVPSGRNFESLKTQKNIKKDAALTLHNVMCEISRDRIIERYILELRMFLKKNNFNMSHYNWIILSFHSGLDKFYSEGSYSIDCSKRPYIKKIIVMLPGQHHPSHRHIDRDELFTVISGNLTLKVEGKNFNLKAGDQFVVHVNKYHEFFAPKGAIFEEISYTENYTNSDYKDNSINKITRSDRIMCIKEKIL